MGFPIPVSLAATCASDPANAAWLAGLPAVVEAVARRWSLRLGDPFDGREVSCAWVAPVWRPDGARAVLKISMPHMEGDHESDALRFLDGDPTVLLLDADPERNAMLLEQCDPGTHLRALPEDEQDVVLAGLLRRLWRIPPADLPFRPLSAMTAFWIEETQGRRERWPDDGIVREGLRLFEELPATAREHVLLATDLHAGNVLRAQRASWLVIDPKPFVGDPAYDATQHLLNCVDRMRGDPRATIARFADLLEVDAERVTLWMFARYAAEDRSVWGDWRLDLARALAP